MTAPQASKDLNTKNFSFAGVLESVLTQNGHAVTWEDPKLDISETFFDNYDAVLVGMGPITSLSANRMYGALNIIDILWGSSKLALFIDAPGTHQIAASLKSIDSNPTSLLKDFYSYRKGYKEVVSNLALSSRIYNAIHNLNSQKWPITIYPSLPWKSDQEVGKRLSEYAAASLVGINLDSYFIQDSPLLQEKTEKWAVDSFNLKETQKLVKTLRYPSSLMKWNKGVTDQQVQDQIARSIGVIIAPNKGDGSWWTYRYIQALNSLTPIYTSWLETSKIGPSWQFLAQSVEDLSAEQRLKLSITQRLEYLSCIPNKQDAIKSLETILNISKAGR